MAQFVVPSLSEAKTTYLADPINQTCTCKAYEHSGRRRWCKHLTFVTNRPDMYAEAGGPGTSTLTPGKKSAGEPTSTLTWTETGLFTVGHSNHTLEAFLHLLEMHGIRGVIDVRSSPYSRRSPYFNRDALRDHVRTLGIDYYWVGNELGGKSPIPITTAGFMGRMQQVMEMATRTRVALMCSEGNPVDCHRAYKLTAYAHRQDYTFAMHILRDGGLWRSDQMEEQQPQSWLSTEFGGKSV